MTIAFVVLLIVLAVWAIGAYNKFIAMQGDVVNGWKQIDVQLKRRHDLIPNLVNAVKGAMDFEKETLEAVIQARNQAVKIQADAMPTSGVHALAQAEAALSGALSKLNVVVERYPDLKATANVGQLQEELTSTENRISFARQHYNDVATNYNVLQRQFPWMLVAGFAKAEIVELWEITDEGEREVPNVDLSMK
ncbi:MAG: LemA family protein [Gemmatimonadota bacterium]|nr:LemA family protein [Gemmatimonadota bacterium]MDH5803916.1 LemA family protein [Gemmatimonadota bacterium]